MLAEGQVLAERFRLETVVDEGGSSTVWAATDTSSGRRVALKLLNDSVPDLSQRIGSFVSAGRRASKAPHPAFVTITAVAQTEHGIPFLVMDLLEGMTSLRRLLDQGEPLSIERALAVMRETLMALAAAHGAGRTHGDVKPGNIMLDIEESDLSSLRLLNLGLSSPMNAGPNATTPAHISGPLDYVAPEWLQRPGMEPTPKGDVFACGVILGEMIMGQLPLAPLKPKDPTIETKLADRNAYYMSGHAVPLPSSTFRDLSPQLLGVLHDATSIDLARRFAEAGQMLRALQSVLDATPQVASASNTFLQAETIISDPPFDLEALRADHPPPAHDGQPPDQRSTMILPPEESTIESSREPDTFEMGSAKGDANRPPATPFGDPFQTTEPDIIDLAPSQGDASSEDIRTETYRAPKPPMSPPREPPMVQGLVDVKTVIFEPDGASEEGLDQVPTMLLESSSPVEETSSPQTSSPPWLIPSGSESANVSAPQPSPSNRGEMLDRLGTSRFGIIVAMAVLFGLGGLGLMAIIYWFW